MDMKYVGRTIALPKEAAAQLVAMQEELKKRLGFAPSLSETVVVAVTEWMRAQAQQEN